MQSYQWGSNETTIGHFLSPQIFLALVPPRTTFVVTGPGMSRCYRDTELGVGQGAGNRDLSANNTLDLRGEPCSSLTFSEVLRDNPHVGFVSVPREWPQMQVRMQFAID